MTYTLILMTYTTLDAKQLQLNKFFAG